MGIIRNEYTAYAQKKDGFLWGFAIEPAQADGWVSATEHENVYDFPGFQSALCGFLKINSKWHSSSEMSRYRSFVSFFTSGWQSFDHWPEKVTLRIHVSEGYGFLANINGGNIRADDFRIYVAGISGYENLNKVYETNNDPNNPVYGFGNTPTWSGAWGAYSRYDAAGASQLAYPLSVRWFQEAADEAVGGTTYQDSSNNTYRLVNGWMEFDIPLDQINNVGETHFMVSAFEELKNTQPDASSPQNGGWIQWNTSASTNDPELVYTFINSPGAVKDGGEDFTMGDLRNTDLTLQRYLQRSFNLDTLLSGVEVVDAFPENAEDIKADRLIALEHISTLSESLNLGDRSQIGNRRFFLDVLSNRKSELLDLSQKCINLLTGHQDMLNFAYGYINPRPYGRIEFRDSTNIPIEDIDRDGEPMYHSAIVFDIYTVSEGG